MMGSELAKRCWMALILACALVAGRAHALPELALADDLARVAQQARERHVPVLLAFMQRDCPYCARARRQLAPLQASDAWRSRAIMLELDVDSTVRMRDFDGQWTTPRDFARRQAVKMVPTVIVFDDSGRQAADAIVGLLTEDFYSFYVERALEAAYAKTHPAH